MNNKLVVIADSTQIDQFEMCPMYWNLASRELLEPIVIDPATGKEVSGISDSIQMGTYGHKLMEIYYKTKANGENQSSCIAAALAFVPDDKITLDKPAVEFIKQRFREYCYTYSHNDIQPIKEDTVEVGFSTPIYETESRLYVLEGRIDLIGTISGTVCIMDHKFQERAHKLYKKSIQFRNYALASGQLLLMINYVRMPKTVTKDTILRDPVSFSKIELEIWKQRLIRVYDKMAAAVQTDNFEQRWSACSGRYNQPCKYTPLCEEWNKELIDSIKMTKYRKKEAFKPW